MEKIAIVTDNSCNIEKAELDKLNVEMIILEIIFSDKTYGIIEGEDIEEFYKKMESEIPTTSVAPPGDILKLFNRLLKEGYDHILVLPISSGFSSFYTQLNLISKEDEYKGKVHIIDSKTISVPLGFLVRYAVKLRDEGKTIDQIINEIQRVKKTSSIHVVLSDLDYLIKGGRVGKLAGNIGNTLNIKPIIRIKNDEGIVSADSFVRGIKKGVNEMAKSIINELKGAKKFYIAIGYGRKPEYINEMKELLSSYFDKAIYAEIASLSPIIAVHSGPNLIGAACLIID